MNFISPAQSNATVMHDQKEYSIKYYKAPLSHSGIIDEAYPIYSDQTAYQVGEFVIVEELHMIYRSSAPDNTGAYPPASPTLWTAWSPLQSWCMLSADSFLGLYTTGEGVVLEFDFSKSTGFAIIDCSFVSLYIEQIDQTAGATIYQERVTGSGYGAIDYHDYFYSPLAVVTRVYRELEWIDNCILRLSFEGTVSIGAIVMGLVESLGCSINGATLSFEDKSTVQQSPLGHRDILRYGSIRVLDATVMITNKEFNNITEKVERIIGRNILFSPTELDQFSESITIGYFENFDIPLENKPSQTTTTIIGVL